jgi:hypothetical protein
VHVHSSYDQKLSERILGSEGGTVPGAGG